MGVLVGVDVVTMVACPRNRGIPGQPAQVQAVALMAPFLFDGRCSMQGSRRKSRGEDIHLGDQAKDEGEVAVGDMKTGRVSLGNIVPGAEVSTC